MTGVYKLALEVDWRALLYIPVLRQMWMNDGACSRRSRRTGENISCWANNRAVIDEHDDDEPSHKLAACHSPYCRQPTCVAAREKRESKAADDAKERTDFTEVNVGPRGASKSEPDFLPSKRAGRLVFESPELAAALADVTMSLRAAFKAPTGLPLASPLGEIALEAKQEIDRIDYRLKKSAVKGVRALERTKARETKRKNRANEREREIGRTLEAVAEHRHGLLVDIWLACCAYERGEATTAHVLASVDVLMTFMDRCDELGWLREPFSVVAEASVVPYVGVLRGQRKPWSWQTAPEAETVKYQPTGVDERPAILKAIRSRSQLRKAEQQSREWRVNVYAQTPEGRRSLDRDRCGYSDFVNETYKLYLERRAKGEEGTLRELTIKCADCLRKAGETDAMNHAESYDFSDGGDEGAPENSCLG